MRLPSRARVALQTVFALNALGISVWFPRIPDVKAALDVDLFTLSVCFLMLPMGTFFSFTYAPAILARLGVRRVATVFGAVFILTFILPAFAWNAPSLGAALFLCGLTVAPIEISMNAKASEFERRASRRVMTQCHAMWSFGSMAGAMLGGVFAELEVTFLAQQFILAPPLALAAFVAGRSLEADDPRVAGGSHRMALPHKAILGLCLLPIGALMLEGAMMEWSALFLREEVLISPFFAAVAFALFSVAMGVARLTGDGLAERWGPVSVIRASAILAAVGILIFATSTGLGQALIGALLLGLGAANIYPLTISIAATTAGYSAERNIAALTLTSFTAFLVGPPLIGSLGHWLGLGTTLLLLTPMALYPLLILRKQVLSPAQGV